MIRRRQGYGGQAGDERGAEVGKGSVRCTRTGTSTAHCPYLVAGREGFRTRVERVPTMEPDGDRFGGVRVRKGNQIRATSNMEHRTPNIEGGAIETRARVRNG